MKWKMLLLAALTVPAASAESADFDRVIRPLLSDRCFRCHGPDGDQREADLRLDTPEFLDRTAAIVVPGDASSSELVRRITAADPDERMPPPHSKQRLTAKEVALLKEWIEEGAEWEEHWAFKAPVRPPLPRITKDPKVRNAIDLFIAQQHQVRGLKANEMADRATLIRRVTIDLTGLPPTPAEVEAFVANDRPHAYEQLVDRLLASPRYGERMAFAWLDAARFADTSGYQNDGPRSMWRWRDWVINAYNQGMPFDQFTIEQIAGDLLTNATLEQRIATGFNRNHRGNSEGGIIPEEYQVEYVVDRVETTSTVWLALTLGCARCHDHKFDPFTQREFYRLYAFFNNIREHGRAIKEGNSPPYVVAPTARQQEQLSVIDAQLVAAKRHFERRDPALEPRLTTMMRQVVADTAVTVSDSQVARFPLNGSADNVLQTNLGEAVVRFEGGEVEYVDGPLESAAAFRGGQVIAAEKIGDFGYRDRFTLMAWVRPDIRGGTLLSKSTVEAQGRGYSVQILEGRVHVNLIVRWLDDAIRVATLKTIPSEQWTHVAVTYDGGRVASGIRVFFDGQSIPLRVDLDAINQTFASSGEPLRIGGGSGTPFHGAIDEVRIYNDRLSAENVAIAATLATATEIAKRDPEQRTPTEQTKLRRHFLEHHASGEGGQAYRRQKQLQASRDELVRRFPTAMVMEERGDIRPTYVLNRGQYDQPSERVKAGLPARLASSGSSARVVNRLDLANWLVAHENPLTARVAVNRYWQQLFGQGLVKTTEDFGTQGERPSHPGLLDWLAVEFRDCDWDIKAIQRKLVTSATYRRASASSPEALERDPQNRFLARGQRYRLSADVIRDQVLAASGLLMERLGGPSVKPYQPADLWRDIATDQKYEQATGAGLYRRSLYTYWKRTVSPPAMANFDASSREICRMRTSRTNTPLQALTLLNETAFVETARVLAQRVMTQEQTADRRLTRAFQLAVARRPNASELEVLREGLTFHLDRYQRYPKLAAQLASAGNYPMPGELNVIELAAYSAIASTILNLDEAISKH